jgi:hypothetical protein
MAEDLPKKALMQEWIHSHEEDSPGTFVFRPRSYSFPPSRGRQGLQFNSDGTFHGEMPGPEDKPLSQSGTWSLDGDKIRLSSGTRSASRELRIESVDPDKLVIQRNTN